MRKKGFTLIEMLIVIAVIGILAVAVLSAINPVEQTRKARDSRRRSSAAELLNAVERYYTTYEEHSASFTSGVNSGSGADSCADAVTVGLVDPVDLADLINSDELKPEFSNRITTASDLLYATLDTDTDLVKVCYQIESQAVRETAVGTCTAGSSTYVCVPE